MEWNHIMNKQPEHNESIIQIDYPDDGHYTMGMRKYYQIGSFKEYLDFCNNNDLPNPNFWWISSKDFPFPDQPISNKREDETGPSHLPEKGWPEKNAGFP
jgi:hypothetical protein